MCFLKIEVHGAISPDSTGSGGGASGGAPLAGTPRMRTTVLEISINPRKSENKF